MKRTNNPLLLLLLLLWLAGGCTQTEVEEKDIPPHALKDVEAVFNLHVKASQTSPTRSAAAPGDTIQTRAEADLPEGRDSEIAGIWIGQYNAQGTLLYHYYNGSLKGNTLNVKLKQNPSGDESESHVWFVANSGDLGEVATEAGLKEHLLSYESNKGIPTSGLCSMTGVWEGVVKEEGDKKINVELTRLLAKITFTYTINEAPNSFSFTPSSITLNSVPDKSQIEAPTAQLPTEKITYTTYTEEVGIGGNSKTVYWYLPENMAGDGDKVESEKKKTGKGVTNATYIELAGTAVQGGVTYKDVVFRFYPGKTDKLYNYDIVRNSHYTMNVTLVGIDITDDRITVGKIPPIEVSGDNMPAEKGGIKEVQITARPGQEWMFDLEGWLTAIIDGKDAGTGAQVTWQGPAKVTFKSTEANPKAELRSVVFPVNVGGTTQEITITQNGSTLEKGDNIMLGAASGSEGASSFTATKGLKWQVDKGADNWWNWVADSQVTRGDEATGDKQSLNIKATASNPSSNQRSGTITVKVGESAGNPSYDKLKQEITVTQAGSTLTGSTKTVGAEAANGLTSTFTATPGLNWAASVTSGSWITVASISGGPTTESAESISYNVAVNPTSSERSDAITVRAGNAEDGPTGTITVTQNASSLTAGDPATLAATVGATGSLKIKGTSGLPLTITPPSWIEITTDLVPAQTTGDEQIVAYKTKEVNLNSTERMAANISVNAGEMTQTVAVKQAGSTFSVSKTELSFKKAGGSETVKVEGTSGLPWTVSPSEETNGIKPDISSSETGDTAQTLTFTASENTGSSRSAKFTIAVKGGDHSKTVEVTQMGATLPGISLTIDQSVLTSYRTKISNTEAYPPFDADGTKNYHGCTVNETQGTMKGSYTIQVEKGQREGIANYATVQSYCAEVTEDGTPKGSWRVPTLIELYAMYINQENITITSDNYWSSSVCSNVSTMRCTLDFSSGNFGGGMKNYENNVRCVRDI